MLHDREALLSASEAIPPKAVLKYSYQACLKGENYLQWLKTRNKRWHNHTYVERHGIWQNSVNDKLGGYLFARKMGVRVPHLMFCTGDGPDALRRFSPPKNGAYVVKDLQGYSSRGAFVLRKGINMLNQKRTGMRDVRSQLKKLKATSIIVEELIDGARINEAIPDDFKFFAFNGIVAAVLVQRNRGTDQACGATFDENWNRLDQFGCFNYGENELEIDPVTGCNAIRWEFSQPKSLCSDREPPRNFPKMLDIAKRLSKRIGVHMRIDILAGSGGEVVLGEFTPWSANGLFHCSAKISDGCVDSCFLGRLWNEASTHSSMEDANGFEGDYLPNFEGGPITPVPEYLKGWGQMTTKEKCDRIATLTL